MFKIFYDGRGETIEGMIDTGASYVCIKAEAEKITRATNNGAPPIFLDTAAGPITAPLIMTTVEWGGVTFTDVESVLLDNLSCCLIGMSLFSRLHISVINDRCYLSD